MPPSKHVRLGARWRVRKRSHYFRFEGIAQLAAKSLRNPHFSLWNSSKWRDVPITRLTGDGEVLAMGTDIRLYAVDPASQYVDALFDAVRWKPFHGGKYAVNDFGYFDGAAELFHLMISEQPLLPGTRVDLNRRDGKVREFLYRHAQDQLGELGLEYEWLVSQGGAQLGSTGMGSAYYRPPELVKLLADATDHIDVADVTLAEVTDIYDGRFRRDTEEEFAIFVDIIDQLLGLFRASARNGFGIVSQMD